MSFGILIDSKNVIKLFNDIAPLINYGMLSRLADRNQGWKNCAAIYVGSSLTVHYLLFLVHTPWSNKFTAIYPIQTVFFSASFDLEGEGFCLPLSITLKTLFALPPNSPVKLWFNIKAIATEVFSTPFNCWKAT